MEDSKQTCSVKHALRQFPQRALTRWPRFASAAPTLTLISQSGLVAHVVVIIMAYTAHRTCRRDISRGPSVLQ